MRERLNKSVITALSVIFVCLSALLFCGCTQKETSKNFIGNETAAEENANPTAPDNPSETTEEKGDDRPDCAFYKIRLILTCTVQDDSGRQKEITCTYDGKTQAIIDGEDITVARGEKFAGLKAAVPPRGNTVNSDEYRFVGWFYSNENGNEMQINENTPFTEESFGTATEITLKVRCERIFSPVMPL